MPSPICPAGATYNAGTKCCEYTEDCASALVSGYKACAVYRASIQKCSNGWLPAGYVADPYNSSLFTTTPAGAIAYPTGNCDACGGVPVTGGGGNCVGYPTNYTDAPGASVSDLCGAAAQVCLNFAGSVVSCSDTAHAAWFKDVGFNNGCFCGTRYVATGNLNTARYVDGVAVSGGIHVFSSCPSGFVEIIHADADLSYNRPAFGDAASHVVSSVTFGTEPDPSSGLTRGTISGSSVTHGCCYVPLDEHCPTNWTLGGGICSPDCNTPTCPVGFTWNPTTGTCDATPVTAAQPANLIDKFGRYCVAYVDNTGAAAIVFRRSDYGDVSFIFSRTVAAGTQPCLWYEHQSNRLYCSFTVSADTKESYSTDDGDTWSTPAVSLSGAKHGTAATNPKTGAILRLARSTSPGTVVGTFTESSFDTPSSVFTCKTNAGANLTVDDDSMSLTFDPIGNRWWLRLTRSAVVEDWYSTNENQGSGNAWTLG